MTVQLQYSYLCVFNNFSSVIEYVLERLYSIDIVSKCLQTDQAQIKSETQLFCIDFVNAPVSMRLKTWQPFQTVTLPSVSRCSRYWFSFLSEKLQRTRRSFWIIIYNYIYWLFIVFTYRHHTQCGHLWWSIFRKSGNFFEAEC